MRRLGLGRLVTAALLACLVCVFPGATAWAQKAGTSAADIEKAKKHMAAGVQFMKDPDSPRYEEAYNEFKKAYDLSGSLNALQNLAICAQNLELDGEAITYYEKYLKGKGDNIDKTTKDQVTGDLDALKSAVAWVTINTDKVGVAISDVRTPKRGSPITNTYKGSIQGIKLGIHPGKHKFTASLEGQKDQVWPVEIANGDTVTHSFNFEGGGPVTAEGFTDKDLKGLGGSESGAEGEGKDEGKKDEGGGVPAYPFVVGAITVAAAVPWIVFGAKSFGQKSEYDDALSSHDPDLEDKKSSLKTTNLVADVFMGVTLTGAVATIVCIAVAASSGGDETETKKSDSTARESHPRRIEWMVSPAVDPRGGGGALVTARF
jgi:tetratricopeptide (TPR) repeat protein